MSGTGVPSTLGLRLRLAFGLALLRGDSVEEEGSLSSFLFTLLIEAGDEGCDVVSIAFGPDSFKVIFNEGEAAMFRFFEEKKKCFCGKEHKSVKHLY